MIHPGKAKTISRIRRYQHDTRTGLSNPGAKRLREYRRKRRLRNRDIFLFLEAAKRAAPAEKK